MLRNQELLPNGKVKYKCKLLSDQTRHKDTVGENKIRIANKIYDEKIFDLDTISELENEIENLDHTDDFGN